MISATHPRWLGWFCYTIYLLSSLVFSYQSNLELHEGLSSDFSENLWNLTTVTRHFIAFMWAYSQSSVGFTTRGIYSGGRCHPAYLLVSLVARRITVFSVNLERVKEKKQKKKEKFLDSIVGLMRQRSTHEVTTVFESFRRAPRESLCLFDVILCSSIFVSSLLCDC